MIYQACGSVVLAHPDPVIILTENKLATSFWVQENGLHHPRFSPANDAAAVGRLIDAVGFPLIAKPFFGKGSEGVTVVEDEIGLLHARERPDMLFQEYVGETTRSTQCAVSSTERVCCRAASSFVVNCGMVFLSIVKWIEMTPFCLPAKKSRTDWGGRGSLNIQLRIHKGRALCLEINARFSGTTGIRAHLGFNDVEFSLRHYFFNEPCCRLPVIRDGLALRYFDEVYPSNLPSSEPVPGEIQLDQVFSGKF